MDVTLGIIRSIWNPQKRVSWWKERCAAVHVDTIVLSAIVALPYQLSRRSDKVAAAIEESWDSVIALCVELAKVNEKAQLSARTPMPTMLFYCALGTLQWSATFAHLRK
eukprot:COSAG01_NODE_55257_length_326_cov_0.938326_1_plen_108_part_11